MMPVYTYECKACKKRHNQTFTVSEYRRHVECHACGKDAVRIYRPVSLKVSWSRPIESYAMGVHPSQIQEARAIDEAHGVPTDYTPDGCPILVSQEHRRRYAEAHGFYDRNAGYGDPVPTGRLQQELDEHDATVQEQVDAGLIDATDL